MKTQKDALDALELAWPHILRECRQVLGSELHYQAVLYHCLRTHGLVPLDQLGMNVKMWVNRPKSKLFQQLDKRKNVDYQGGFEPIPDIVMFSPQIAGDWRRRKWEITSKQILAAIEVKASEREGDRLTRVEIMRDIEKLCAHREELKHLGADMAPVVMVVDSAPLGSERMRNIVLLEVLEFAKANDVSFFYLSQDEDIVYRAPVVTGESQRRTRAKR